MQVREVIFRMARFSQIAGGFKTHSMKLSIYACFLSFALHPMTYAQEGKKEPTKYLGEVQPGLTARLFAPGLVSMDSRYEFGSTFSPDGKEFYYATEINNKPEIWAIRLVNNS